MRTSQKKQILSFSIFVILLAQISLDIFASNFRVSMGILLLPILVFLYQKISVMPIVLLAGSGVYLSRVLLHGLQYGFSYQSLLDFFPELIFYYVYGCLFFLYFRKKEYKLPHKHCYAALFFIRFQNRQALFSFVCFPESVHQCTGSQLRRPGNPDICPAGTGRGLFV